MFTLILIGLSTFLLFVYFKIKFNYWERRGIKGPKPILFLGTLIAENVLPPKEIEEKFLKEFGHVFGTFFGTQPILNLSDVDHIKQVLSDLKTFPMLTQMQFTDKYLTHSMLFKNGSDWKAARSAQSPAYTSKKLRNLLDHFEKVTTNFLDNLESIKKRNESNDVEFKELAKFYSIDIISKVMFAIDVDSYKEQDKVLVKHAAHLTDLNNIQSALMAILPYSISSALKLNAFNITHLVNLGDYFKKVLKQRRQSGVKYNDMSELLQDAIDEGKLTEQEAIGNILLSFFAGVEPIANSVLMLFYYLSEHPEVQTKLYDEIVKEFGDQIDYERLTQAKYLDAVVNESLRLGNNNLLATRTAAIDTQLGDLKIEKGTEIRLVTYLPHVLSKFYPNPKKFNPDRFLKGSNDELKKEGSLFIPFSMGPKNCIGMRLALCEIKYVCVRALQNYEICKPKEQNLKVDNFRGFVITRTMNIGFKKRTPKN